MSIVETISLVLGGGTLGVIATALAKGRKAREASATAVVPQILGRMKTLDEKVDTLRKEVDDCHSKHEECTQQTTSQGRTIEEQGRTIKELQDMITRSSKDITRRIDLAAERVARRQSDPSFPALVDGSEADTSPETPTAIGRMRVRELPPPPNKKDPRRQ